MLIFFYYIKFMSHNFLMFLVVNDSATRRMLLRPLSVSGSGQRADTLAELFAQSAGRHRFHRSISVRQSRTQSQTHS